MVIYHFLFDLSYFNVADIDLSALPLVLFQRSIGTLFLFLVGVSLFLSESHNKEGYIHHAKRGLKLGLIALAITAATWIYPHEGFISFGIIHMIALSTLIAPFFFRFARWNILIGLMAIALGFLMAPIEVESKLFFWLGLTFPGYTALDYYPLFPWLGIILIGIAGGEMIFHKGHMETNTRPSALMEKLAFLGKNSLMIYLAHQIVLVGLVLGYILIR